MRDSLRESQVLRPRIRRSKARCNREALYKPPEGYQAHGSLHLPDVFLLAFGAPVAEFQKAGYREKSMTGLDQVLDVAFDGKLSLNEIRALIEKRYIEHVLVKCAQNKTVAAEFLKVHRNTFYRRSAMAGLNVKGLKWKHRRAA